MKFPITREELQSYNYSSIMQMKMEEKIHKKITEIIQNICDDFERNLPNNVNEKKFVWNWGRNGYRQAFYTSLVQYNWGGTNGLPMDPNAIQIYTENIKNSFMERLRELFLGCTIIMDPLDTYILIEWL